MKGKPARPMLRKKNQPDASWKPRLECLEDRTIPSVVAGGDFNGDGNGDLAIGVPGEDIGAKSNAGAVNVIYGTASGLDAVNNQFWHQDSPVVENFSEAGDQFGFALAVGDFNGDGYDDMAVGAPYEDVGSIADGGSVNIIYGSPAGLSATFVPDQTWTQSTPGTKHKSGKNDRYGFSLATADFNSDGFADLAIGVPGNSAGKQNVQQAGGVSILFGTAAGLTATTPDDQWLDMLTVGIRGNPRTGDLFGYNLAAGDFNSDGHPDLAVGIPLADAGATGGIRNAGAVSLIYGSSSGLTATGNQLWYQGNSGVKGAVHAGNTVKGGDQFGTALAAGDYNGDGRMDLAIGVPFEDVGTAADAGAFHVLHGSAAGLTALGGQFWTQNQLAGGQTASAGDRLGLTLAAGDFNADGRTDLAVGVPYEDLGGIRDAGGVHIVMGSANGLTGTGGQFWSQNSPGISEPAETDDHFGGAFAVGDFNGDRRMDLAIGVANENLGAAADAGIVHVLYSSTSGLTGTGSQVWSQDSPGILDMIEAGDWFGLGLGAR
jgi:hypothetical protein